MRSICAPRRNHEMSESTQNDSAFEGEIPIFEVLDVAGDAVFDIGAVPGFAPKSSNLGQAGDPGLHKGTDVVIRHQLGKLLVVFNQVRPRADDAHVAPKHVPELRHLVDAQLAKPFSERVNPFISVPRLARDFIMTGLHGAKLVDLELPVLHSGAGLNVKKWSRRLKRLRYPDDDGENWERSEERRVGK